MGVFFLQNAYFLLLWAWRYEMSFPAGWDAKYIPTSYLARIQSTPYRKLRVTRLLIHIFSLCTTICIFALLFTNTIFPVLITFYAPMSVSPTVSTVYLCPVWSALMSADIVRLIACASSPRNFRHIFIHLNNTHTPFKLTKKYEVHVYCPKSLPYIKVCTTYKNVPRTYTWTLTIYRRYIHKYMPFIQHTVCACGVQHLYEKVNSFLQVQKVRTQPGLNQGPLHLQSNALPLCYISMSQIV